MAVTFGYEGDDADDLTRVILCNGEEGGGNGGADGRSAFVDVEELAEGDEECPSGGLAITYGYADEGPEDHTTVYLCNPFTGELGPTLPLLDGTTLDDLDQAPLGYAFKELDLALDVSLHPSHIDESYGARLQCRWGKVQEDGTLDSSARWVDCPEAPLTPEHDRGLGWSDGLYATEYRVRAGLSVSTDPVRVPYYLHNNLDSAPSCDRRAPESEFFEVARDLMGPSTSGAFRVDGDPEEPGYVQLSNPFVSIHFDLPVRRSLGFLLPSPTFSSSDPSMVSGQVQVNSLRRRFVLSDDRQQLLIYRTYASRRGNSTCKALSVARQDERRFAMYRRGCDAVVLDRDGVGVCLDVDDDGLVHAVDGWRAGDWQVGAWFHGFVTAAMPPDQPLRAGVDNAMWRDLISQYRDNTPNGSRNFSSKCWTDPRCAEGQTNRATSGLVSWLYLPDVDFYPNMLPPAP
ncbi:MAG: hypothetical protein EA397_18145 [Deltaproteobacteria bacterium]|nr:MAG: hypothetical protein EA397_18145 [Deltaproteobacteria bacterium]